MSQQESQVSVEQLEWVAKETIEKIKELGLGGKLKEEAERLLNIVNDLRDWMEKVPAFTVRPALLHSISSIEDAEIEYVVQGLELRRYVRVSGRFAEVKLIDIYKKLFEDTGVFNLLLHRFVETLASIAVTVKENYDLVKKLEQIEERLSDP
jgi:hypothetical protein